MDTINQKKEYMLKNLILIITLIISYSLSIKAQDENGQCGWYEAQEAFFEEHPEAKEKAELEFKNFNAFAANFDNANKMTPDTVIIPIVFHIIHINGPENVSNQLIYDAVDQMNMDYMATNSDLSEVVEDFVDIIGNTKIIFRLAQIDPDGNCTNGITRTVSELTNTGGNALKNLIYWPRDSYLNVWVSKIALETEGSGTVLGYSQYPSTVHNYPGNDGIVVRSNAIGYDKRTLTHEAAHWMNIIHVWGDSNEAGLATNCSESDFVGDTPNTIGHTSGCSLSSESCGSLDNIQNYMDYGTCKRMFTEGQSNRMIAALNSYLSQRNQIWTNANLIETGVNSAPQLCASDFIADEKRICSGTEVQFTNASYNGDTEWTWTFEGGEPSTSNEENPLVIYNTPGTYPVSLTISNGNDELTEIKESFIHVLEDVGSTTPILEGFESATTLPNDDWTIFSTDEDRYWEVTNAASNSGSKSVVLKNYYQNEGNVDELESNSIDLSGLEEVAISFKYAYAKRHNADTDVLKLKVTRTCGTNWLVKETLKANDGTLVTAPNHAGYFTPESTEWNEAYIDNISYLYLIENFRFKFEFNSGDGNNIYLDDINIFDPTTVGINEVNKAALKYKVFPNPIENTLNISFNLLHNTDVVGDVYDISGRKVMNLFDRSFQIGVNEMQVNTADWNSGMYFVRIQLEGETFIEKVIKN